ncbi:hypothetical protein N7493_011895 [Penicillium malachiteum]|uniref:Uncharacterized protein n=1 Tax=Penicillium malachiteum TaxID=1324776 RepID=A0AAD6MQA2_9EURO|nr:hypothetical protein N7493_011895 [Penicillium malachiteum]
MTTPLTSRDILQAPLPDLRRASNRTHSSALKNLHYVGHLEHWSSFELADEHGLQGRFSQHVGQILSAVFQSENMALCFADAKAASLRTLNTPDLGIIDKRSNLLVVGEMKVPWIKSHSLARAIFQYHRGEQHYIRHCLGQVSNYMWENRLRYAILTTYDETVFLRRSVQNQKWQLEFSSLVKNASAGNSTTVRKAFWFIARESLVS